MKNFDFFQKCFVVFSLTFWVLLIGSSFVDVVNDTNKVVSGIYSMSLFILLFGSLALSVMTFFMNDAENIGWGSFDYYTQFNVLKVVNLACAFTFIAMLVLSVFIAVTTGENKVATWISVTGILSLFGVHATAFKSNLLIVKNSQDPVVIEYEENRRKLLEEAMF